MVKNRIPVCPVAVCFRNAACLTSLTMKENAEKINRIIGLDMHPDVFAAAALEKSSASQSQVLWVHDRQQTGQLEKWARKHVHSGDVLVLEASGNSFEVARRLHRLGLVAVVLESTQAAKIRENFCNDDRHSAIKLARIYLSGLAKVVWQPDDMTRQMREVLFAHRSVVKDCTRLRNRIRTFLNEYCVRLAKGTSLVQKEGLDCALKAREWTPLQTELLRDRFTQLQQAEARRKHLEKMMVRELIERPQWARLWRLMGIRHIVAFGLMAMIGDIKRFPTSKKLVGYIGLSPSKKQSGNNAKGKELGTGNRGRGDLRALLVQAAQNALNYKNSPLHKWGWKLTIKKHRNLAVAAVARKITTSVWHMLMGHFTPLLDINKTLYSKLDVIAGIIGKEELSQRGFQKREDFILSQFEIIKL
jgi:transposase